MSGKVVRFQYAEGHHAMVDEIVLRRFGSLHEKKCARSTILTCALWDCQVRNRCKLMDAPGGEMAS